VSELLDLIVTDPPYGLKFMGRNWDKAMPSIEIWEECLRVLKSGAFAFVMCISRQDCLSRMQRYFCLTRSRLGKGVIMTYNLSADIQNLSKASITQLRQIAKVMHVEYYSKLKRDELVLAIIAKKDELWQKQQTRLFQ